MSDPSKNQSADNSPILGVVGTVRKLLNTESDLVKAIASIKASEDLKPLIESEHFKQLEKVRQDFSAETSELLSTLSKLFDQYTAILEKSTTAASNQDNGKES